MNTHDYIPRSNNKFYEWVTNFMRHLEGKEELLHIPAEWYQRLKAETAAFVAAFKVAGVPDTRTVVTVQGKNAARKTLEKDVRQTVAEYMTHSRLLTDSDRDLLGLPVHKTTRTPAPVAADAPDSDTDTSVIGRVGISFYERGHGHKKAKPFGQHCAEIAWVLSDTPVTRWDGLIHSNVDTNSPLTLSFENDQRGKTVYFALRWENTRGEKGPWSNIKNAIIP
jgi:hypothetical protein